MTILEKEFRKALETLTICTLAKDKMEMAYEEEKARMLFSAEVSGFGNQTKRDAQTLILLKEKGLYEKMVNIRTDYRIAYYKWSSLKSLIDGRKYLEYKKDK